MKKRKQCLAAAGLGFLALLAWAASGGAEHFGKTAGGNGVTASVEQSGKHHAAVLSGRTDGSEEAPEAEGEMRPAVALTFDDGPDSVWTEKLLDGLKERNVKATFFLLGQSAEENDGLVKRMQEEGHLIGNHTYSHVELTKLSEAEAIEEVNRTNRVIFDATGSLPYFVRPPFGEWPAGLEDRVMMIPVKWTVDSRDWYTRDTEAIVTSVLNDAGPDDIILMHDRYETSVDAALQIVDAMTEEGYEFVTVDELILV